MRVLFYSSIFPRPWNTIRGIYCFHVCRALEQLGHPVRVVSPRSWRERRGASASLPGLSELKVEYPLYVYPPGILQSEYHRFMALSSRRVMSHVMADFRPDAILSYWAHPDGAVAARYARGARVPSAVIVGGSDVLVLARHADRRRRSVVRALNDVDAVITVGRELARSVEALGVPASKVHVVYQGVDPIFSPGPATVARQRLGIPQNAEVLVSVGSLVPVKGIDVLLKAVSRLARERRDLKLYLVGDGASRGELQALAARLGMEKIVTFVGKVEPSALPDWYRAADLTVLASRSEGVPNVLRESLACGTRFVATSVGGVHEIAEGTSCRLVPAEDPGALSAAVGASLAEAAQRGRDGGGKMTKVGGLLTWQESSQQIVDVLARTGMLPRSP